MTERTRAGGSVRLRRLVFSAMLFVASIVLSENRPAPPPTIDLQPNNAHPNLDGIRFYGEYVAAIIEPHVKRR